MREAYRLQKSDFYGRLTGESKVIFMFVYVSNEILSFEEISKSTTKLLDDMVRSLNNEKIDNSPSNTSN